MGDGEPSINNNNIISDTSVAPDPLQRIAWQPVLQDMCKVIKIFPFYGSFFLSSLDFDYLLSGYWLLTIYKTLCYMLEAYSHFQSVIFLLKEYMKAQTSSEITRNLFWATFGGCILSSINKYTHKPVFPS